MNDRINKLIQNFQGNFEAAIITSHANRYYFLGTDTHDAGTLIILKDKIYYIIDSRYIEVCYKTIDFANIVLQNNTFDQIAKILKDNNICNVYVEDNISVAYERKLKSTLSGISNIQSDSTLKNEILKLRMVKSDEEIENIKQAQKITDDCFLHILNHIKPGVSEIDIALEMEMYIRKNGAEDVSFPIILVSGANTSLPHGVPSNKTINNGDFVTMDFGAKFNGYCSDMTRTIAVGSVSDEMKKIYDIVLNAQLSACNFARAGLKGCEVDAVARNIINTHGYADNFGHGLGHSLGIEIHEDPRFSPIDNRIVPEGSVMSIEPGIYLPGKFGVRIEDIVIVKQDGIENLTKSDKNLFII